MANQNKPTRIAKKDVTTHPACDVAAAISVGTVSSIWLIFRASREPPSPKDALGDLSLA
jgi:hypothetical protein